MARGRTVFSHDLVNKKKREKLEKKDEKHPK
jgi:hypothetical protein